MAHGDDGRFEMSRNFLATDKVPDSIFGYPIASRKEDYTPEDIKFFKAHPEAGGYYDLGEGSPEDGTEEGAPVQADEAGVSVPVVPDNVRQQEVVPVNYGRREDGTFKGTGWDRIELPDGGFASEFSVGVNIDGKDLIVPSIIPNMTDDDKAMLKEVILEKKPIPEDYMQRIVKFAAGRIKRGQSPFKNDGVSAADYESIMGGPYRQFALQDGHETFPGMFWRVGKNGGRELMMRVNPALDAWGYKRVHDKSSPGGWRQHQNTIPIRLSSWIDSAAKEDEITTAAAERTLNDLGFTSQGLRNAFNGFIWDTAFVKGGPGTPGLFQPAVSSNLHARAATLVSKGVPAEEAMGAALFEQVPTYQKGNKNRARHRTEQVAERLKASKGLLGELAKLYTDAVKATKPNSEHTADDRAFNAHANGMNAVSRRLNAITGKPIDKDERRPSGSNDKH